MQEFSAKMGENGRIVIPAVCRQQLQLEPGEELILRIENDELHVFSLKHSLRRAQALVKRHTKNKNPLKMLRQMRDEDEADERKSEKR